MRLFLHISTGQRINIRNVLLREILLRAHLMQCIANRLKPFGAMCILSGFRVVAMCHVQRRGKGLLERLFLASQVDTIAVDHGFICLILHGLVERLAHTLGHRKVKGVDGLAAEHIVLVALDRDAGEARIGADAVRLAQEAVSRGEATVEQLQQVDLAAVEGDQREILVVDMDVVLTVGLGRLLIEHIVIDKVLRTLGTELQHDAHGRIRVDVRVIALQVDILGVGKEDILIRLHKVLLCGPALSVLLAIGDIFLRHIVEVILHELLLNDILNLLDPDAVVILQVPLDLLRHCVDVALSHLAARIHVGGGNGVADLLPIIGHGMAGTFDNSLDHLVTVLYLVARSPAFHYILWFMCVITVIHYSGGKRFWQCIKVHTAVLFVTKKGEETACFLPSAG